MHEPRFILHIDLDAYYASIEQRDRPDLRGKQPIKQEEQLVGFHPFFPELGRMC